MLEGLIGHILAQIADRLMGWAFQPRWLVQWRLRAATGKKITILVAKIEGDNETNGIREEIIDSIKRELGQSVEPYRWSRVLSATPGSHEIVETALQKTARQWLKRKRCDLLVSGRIKVGNVISLKFIPTEKSEAQPQTYVLTSDTLELPERFISDLGVAIAANVTASARNAIDSRKYMVPTLQALSERLDAATGETRFDSAILGTLIHLNALVKLNLFEQAGTKDCLEQSIRLNREALLIRTREAMPDEWSSSQNNLGTSLDRLGELSGDVKYMNEAIDALNAALEERSPHKSLSRWTGTQVNLAGALSILGRYEQRDINWERANFIYDLIISPELREADAQLWAIAQCNRGLLLVGLAEREVGLNSLTVAQRALTEALEVLTLSKAPFDWASLKINLGVVLMKMGDRSRLTADYEGAAEQFIDALKVISRDHTPKKWALIQNNLGTALSFVGDGNSNPKTLHRAISAIHKALTVYTQTDEPTRWAQAKHSHGRALMILGRIEEDSRTLRQAVGVLNEALAAALPSYSSAEWRSTMHDLGSSLSLLGQMESDVPCLTAARSTFEELLQHLSSTTPTEWTNAVLNLGDALRVLGELQTDIFTIEESIDSLSQIFDVITPTSDPIMWAKTHISIAKAYAALAELRPNADSVDRSRENCHAALSVLSEQTPPNLRKEIDEVLRHLEEMERLISTDE